MRVRCVRSQISINLISQSTKRESFNNEFEMPQIIIGDSSIGQIMYGTKLRGAFVLKMITAAESN